MAHQKTISDLLSYRLARLAGSLSRSAGARYRRDFDVSLGEWRVLALLGQDPEITLNRLARRAALDKAQMSRAVTKLEARGLLCRTAGPRRSTQLSLTDEGDVLYRGLIKAANQRDRMLEKLVPAEKLVVFSEVLAIMDEFARELEEAESGTRHD